MEGPLRQPLHSDVPPRGLSSERSCLLRSARLEVMLAQRLDFRVYGKHKMALKGESMRKLANAV